MRDLDIPVEIIGGELLRESDGLAMSSRNLYLSHVERKQVCILLSFTLILPSVVGLVVYTVASKS